ncbi:hypothetical protein FPK49_27725, partial [Acinetobacter baumannii]|nr:hypothetical protein [Acinetobacter baumannii]
VRGDVHAGRTGGAGLHRRAGHGRGGEADTEHAVDPRGRAGRLGGGSGGGDDGRHRPREAAGDSAAGGDGLGRLGRCRRGL